MQNKFTHIFIITFLFSIVNSSLNAQNERKTTLSKNHFDFALSYGAGENSHFVFNSTYSRSILSFMSLGLGAAFDLETSSNSGSSAVLYGRISLNLPSRRNTPYLSLDVGKAFNVSSNMSYASGINSYDTELGYRFSISEKKDLLIGIGFQTYLLRATTYGGYTDSEVYFIPQFSCGLRL